jgi:hypothetical protein
MPLPLNDHPDQPEVLYKKVNTMGAYIVAAFVDNHKRSDIVILD